MPCKPSELSRTLSLMVFPRSLTNMGVKGTPTTVFTQLSGSLEMITEFTLLKLLNVVYLRSREVPITGSSSGKFPQPTCYRGFVAVGFQHVGLGRLTSLEILKPIGIGVVGDGEVTAASLSEVERSIFLPLVGCSGSHRTEVGRGFGTKRAFAIEVVLQLGDLDVVAELLVPEKPVGWASKDGSDLEGLGRHRGYLEW